MQTSLKEIEYFYIVFPKTKNPLGEPRGGITSPLLSGIHQISNRSTFEIQVDVDAIATG